VRLGWGGVRVAGSSLELEPGWVVWVGRCGLGGVGWAVWVGRLVGRCGLLRGPCCYQAMSKLIIVKSMLGIILCLCANRTATSAPHTRPTQWLSRPPSIQKLGAENHMLHLNIGYSITQKIHQ